MDDLQAFRDGAVETAKDLNVVLIFEVVYTGKTGVYLIREAGIDSGVSAKATFLIMPDDNAVMGPPAEAIVP